MKHRLKSAVDRANKLEDDLANAHSSNGQGDSFDSMERGKLSRRKRTGAANTGSIRSAMRLDSTAGDRSEKIGQVVDVVDSFAVSTGTLYFASRAQDYENVVSICIPHFLLLLSIGSLGKYLRRNPLARAGFIFYLMLVHLWCFAILFYHSHSLEFAGEVSHGPHAMVMQQQQRVKPITAMKGDAAEVKPALRKQDAIASDAGKTPKDAGSGAESVQNNGNNGEKAANGGEKDIGGA